MKQLYTELNAAQKLIYTASNIGRAYKDFDYSGIAGIHKHDQHCVLVRTDGSEELYKASLVQDAYLKFSTRLVDFFHCLGPNYRGPSLWRNGAYVMLKGIHYAHSYGANTELAKAQRKWIDQFIYLDRESLITLLENDQLNLGHLIVPGDKPWCSCGSFQKQLKNLKELKQETFPEFQPSCIHLVWYYTFLKFREQQAALLASLHGSRPTKCGAWWYSPMKQGGPTPFGKLKILYTNKGATVPANQWYSYNDPNDPKELRSTKEYNQDDLWTYLFKMINAGYITYCGATTLPQIKLKSN
jgi:hypothetical protein